MHQPYRLTNPGRFSWLELGPADEEDECVVYDRELALTHLVHALAREVHDLLARHAQGLDAAEIAQRLGLEVDACDQHQDATPVGSCERADSENDITDPVAAIDSLLSALASIGMVLPGHTAQAPSAPIVHASAVPSPP